MKKKQGFLSGFLFGGGVFVAVLAGVMLLIMFVAAILVGLWIYQSSKHEAEVARAQMAMEQQEQQARERARQQALAVAKAEAEAEAARQTRKAEVEKAEVVARERLKKAKDAEDAAVKRAEADAERAKAQLDKARLEQQERDRGRKEKLEAEKERKRAEEAEKERKWQEEEAERERKREEERQRPIAIDVTDLWRTGAKLKGRNVAVTGTATCKVFASGNATYTFCNKDGTVLVQAHQDKGDKDNDGLDLKVEITGKVDSVGKVVYLRDSKVKLKK